MTIVSSTNYYTDLLESKKLHDFFFDFEIDALKRKVSEVYDQYYEIDSYCSEDLKEANNDKEIQELTEKLKDNEATLDRKLKLIDEVFSLHIYKTHVEQKIPRDTFKALHSKIIGELDNLAHAEKEETYAGLRKRLLDWRENTSALSYVSYPPREDDKATKLDRCITKAKYLAENTLELYRYPEVTVNAVYFLYQGRSFHGIRFPSAEPIAVLKGCKKTDDLYKLRQATPVMEVIAYEAAKILGLGDLFTPTTLTSIQSMECDYEGCIQPFIKGDRLDSMIDYGDTIPYLSMIDGLIAALIMGMSDAHGENIMINGNDEVKYFDNSRSLPHSNKVIKRPGGFLITTFRNSLIIDEYVFESFGLDAIMLINKRVTEAKKNIPVLGKYLIEEQKKCPLPEHWLEPALVIGALTERLSAIEAEMKTYRSPLDLIFAANPYYKFYVSLHIAYQYLKNKSALFTYMPTREDYPDADLMYFLFYTICNKRHHSFNTMINKCHLMFINPIEIWQICKVEAYWKDWLLDILDYLDTVLYPSDEELKKDPKVKEALLSKDVEVMLQILESSSELDFKDPVDKVIPKA